MEEWKYTEVVTNEEIESGEYAGFVYLFHFPDEGRFYVGSKQIFKRVKDSKKYRDNSVSNGWEDYSSSSRIVNQKIADGENYTRTILWPFKTMKETLLVESALILSVGLNPNCLNMAVMHKARLPGLDDRKRLYGVIQEIQGWIL